MEADDLAFPFRGVGYGLTKREYIAIQLMAAYMTKYGGCEAKWAVKCADELIKELSK